MLPLHGSGRPKPITPLVTPDDPVFSKLSKTIYDLYQSGHYSQAITLYSDAAEKASEAKKWKYASKFLNNEGACQIAVFQYRDALKSLEAAREVTLKTGNLEVLASLDLNISSLFHQINNAQSAEAVAQQGLAYLGHQEHSSTRAKLILQLAFARARQGDFPQAEKQFSQAIDEAYDALDVRTAAWAWDYLGNEKRLAGYLDEAERASSEALRLRKAFHLPDSESALWNLAMIQAARLDFRSARVLMNAAVAELNQPSTVTASWNIFGDQGKIKLQAGDLAGALEDLHTALRTARAWRIGVIDSDTNRMTSESGLSGLYAAFIETGNQLYLQTHNPALVHETFEAAEENRAASLRAMAPQPNDWRSRLPAHYWELLPKIQQAEQTVLHDDSLESRANVDRLRAELERLEAAAGSPTEIDSKKALEKTQAALDSRSALLSFRLGAAHSWLWAVTQDHYALYRLPPRFRLATAIQQFQSAIRDQSGSTQQAGASLYQALFSSLSPEFKGKNRWLLALDEDLFSLPFSALVAGETESGPLYLGEQHALQITSGAMMLRPNSQTRSMDGPFLAVGDPIYNRADQRWTGPDDGSNVFFGWREAKEPTTSFARLWGTQKEIETSAHSWGAKSSILLTGKEANKERFWNETRTHPSVIHFATHILEANEKLHTGWIALSLGANGEPEFLAPAEISARIVDAKLVVLSGCSSGNAQVRSASGLMGLTRAWIAAGAGAVLATRWPVVDDNGALVSLFYHYLRQMPSGGPAQALQLAQNDMIHSGNGEAILVIGPAIF